MYVYYTSNERKHWRNSITWISVSTGVEVVRDIPYWNDTFRIQSDYRPIYVEMFTHSLADSIRILPGFRYQRNYRQHWPLTALRTACVIVCPSPHRNLTGMLQHWDTLQEHMHELNHFHHISRYGHYITSPRRIIVFYRRRIMAHKYSIIGV